MQELRKKNITTKKIKGRGRMTEKRFRLISDSGLQYYDFIEDNGKVIHTSKVVELLNSLAEENEQLKQSSTMYYKLFKGFQKEMKDVKQLSDLDHIDLEDLIQLSKGNVFDDKLGWIHLPIKELEE